MNRDLSSLDCYRRLTALSRELDGMADACMSVAGETALRAAARIVRTLTSGFWLTMEGHEMPPQERREAPPSETL